MTRGKGAVCSSRDPLAAFKIASIYPEWYYTWSPTDLGIPIEFVPMVWSEKHITRDLSHYRYVLGFNEPDRGDQADMTPEEAAKVWKFMRPESNFLGAPATAANPSRPQSWLKQFMDHSEYGFDFLPLHIYHPPNVGSFIEKIERCYRVFQKPIWLTEFACTSTDLEQVLEFANKSIRQMPSCVERFAWKDFDGFDYAPAPSHLWEVDGRLTKLGELYRFL